MNLNNNFKKIFIFLNFCTDKQPKNDGMHGFAMLLEQHMQLQTQNMETKKTANVMDRIRELLNEKPKKRGDCLKRSD